MKLLIEKDVEIPMRDGVILRADIYRPDDGESIRRWYFVLRMRRKLWIVDGGS